MVVASVYEHVLGDEFKLLSPGLAVFHSLSGACHFQGHANVVGASNPVARLLAKILGLPLQSGESAISFSLVADTNKETWVREFPGKTMRSILSVEAGFIVERLGPVLLRSTLAVSGASLQMRIKDVSLWGICFPAWSLPDVIADEVSSGNKLFFDIKVRWAWLGTLVEYTGFLDLSSMSRLP